MTAVRFYQKIELILSFFGNANAPRSLNTAWKTRTTLNSRSGCLVDRNDYYGSKNRNSSGIDKFQTLYLRKQRNRVDARATVELNARPNQEFY
jgi:hypothetical protein